MAENNKKMGFWLSADLDEKIDIYLRLDNCANGSKFVEKALRFYLGYLNTGNASAFLPEALSTMLIGTLDIFGQRIGTQLNKVAIEQNMCNHILVEDTDMDEMTTSSCVDEVPRGAEHQWPLLLQGCAELPEDGVIHVEARTEKRLYQVR